MPKSSPSGDSDSDSLVKLVDQLSDPSQANAAIAELWERTAGFLKWRVAGLIADRHQSLISESSVANEAFHQFFEGHAQGKFQVDDRHGLLALLGKIAIRRLVDRVRRLDADKRRPQRELSAPNEDEDMESAVISDADVAALLDELDAHDMASADEWELGAGQAVASPESVRRDYRVSHPVDSAASDSQSCLPPIDRLLTGFDPLLRQVFEERIADLPDDLREVFELVHVWKRTDEEVAERLDISGKLVRRKIESIREAFLDLKDDSIMERINRRNRTHRAP